MGLARIPKMEQEGSWALTGVGQNVSGRDQKQTHGSLGWEVQRSQL